MEFYFTDRMRRLIATVSTDETDGLMMDGDTETQSLVAGSRTLEGVVHYNADQIDLAKAACAGGNLILYKERDSEAVVTEIMHVEHSALDMTYTITADSAGVDLLDETVDEYAADDEHDIEFYLTKFIWDSGWTIRKNEVDKSYLKLSWDSDDETALARVLDVADKFGAELDFGFTMGSDGTFEKYIDVYQKRGTATDDELVRDVNINNITTTVDLYDMFTSVKAKADVQDAKGAPITLKGLSYESDDGRYVLGSDGVLRDTVAVQDWSRILSVSNPDPTVHHLQRVKTYSTGITTLAEDSPTIKQYPQKITAKQKNIATLQKKIKATNGYIANQKKYIANKETYIKECNARIAKYTAKGQTKYVAAQQGYIANANKSIKGYNTKINEYDSDIKKYNAQIAADNVDIKTMKAGKDLLLTQVQSKLLDMALADLKAHCEPTMTYEVDIAKLPDGVRIGDTLHIVDDAENQYLNARVLELQYSYSMKTGTATLGDYKVEQSEVDPALAAMAESLRTELMANQTYTWVRYADDDQGAGISVLPAGKKYMAIIAASTPEPSDDPAEYAGHWALVGSESTYTHLAYANSDDGSKDFATTPVTGTQYSYLGTAISTDNVAPTDPADYTWQFFKGVDGADGKPGTDGLTTYVHKAWANSVDGVTDFTLTDSADKDYFGVYTDTTADASSDPTKYSWMLLGGKAVKEVKAEVEALVPAPSSGTAYPETPVTGQQFWLVQGSAASLYQYDGSKWQAVQLDAKSLSVETLNALVLNSPTINGGTVNGSTFTTDYDYDSADSPTGEGSTSHHVGTLKMGDGVLKGTEDITSNETPGAPMTARLIVSPGTGLRFGVGMDDTDGNVDITSLPEDEESITLSYNGLALKEPGTDVAYVLTADMLKRMNFSGNVLWSGAWAMADTTTLTLPKKISQCLNGIVLLWGTGQTNAPGASDYTMTFIPKWFAADHSGRGIDCFVGNAGKNTFGIKYIYVTDTTLKGYANNRSNEAANKVLQGVYEY